MVIRTTCSGGHGDGGQHVQSLWGWLVNEKDDDIIVHNLLDMRADAVPEIIPLTSPQGEIVRIANEVAAFVKHGMPKRDLLLLYSDGEGAKSLILAIEADSVTSQMRNKEIAHAVKNSKRILHIVIRDAGLRMIHPEISKPSWKFCHEGQGDFNQAIEEAFITIYADYE